MKLSKIILLSVMIMSITACSIMKKGNKSVTLAANSRQSTTDMPGAAPVAKSTDGVFAPGNDELNAIQVKYKEVTLQTLNDGYALFTGVCTNCHGKMNIYQRPETAWPSIIDEMAPKAKITNAQKDALYMYVLAIKATQNK